ncbi:hypothetical protein ACFFWC_04920 [Plantactinospora siamensis]|uniref:Secreted protein/lipoprotein n=1 Tax=Plantactinospora siamensis TaxID=555372 RepID=A0ABV6NRF3_9ACTN
MSAAVLAAALAGGTVACGSSDGPAAMSDTAAHAASPAADDPHAADAKRAALAAYAGYLSASRRAEQRGDPTSPELRRYLADPLLTQVRVMVREVHAHGATRIGTMRSNPEVTTVSLADDPATVVIQDCLDATGYRLVYRRNSAPVPGSTGGRHLVTATATRYPDGRWLISDGAAYQDQPC